MEKVGVTYSTALRMVCNQPKDFIDALAEKASAEMLPPGGDILALVAKLQGRISYRDLFDETTDVNTIFVHGPNDFDIVLPAHSTPRRDRFTIAHELGHYFLHAWMGQRPLIAARNGSDRAEWEANWFAAGFLMPKLLFKQKYNENRSLSLLADTFDVSEHAARVRCSVLGLKI